MGVREKILVAATLAMLAGVAVASVAQAAVLRTGDILVADPDTPGDGAVIKVNPRTGAQSILSNNASSTQDLFQSPIGIAIDRRGNIIVADNQAFAPDAGSDGGLITVDPRTGEQSTLVDGTAPGALIDEPDGLAFSPRGFLAVADFDAGSAEQGALIKVNPRTGAQALLADNSTSSADLFEQPVGVAFERRGRPVVTEFRGPPGGETGLLRVSLRGGELTGLSLGGFFEDPYSLTILPGGKIVVADEEAFNGNTGALISVNPRTGAQTFVSNNALSGPDLFEDPSGLVREPRGSYVVADWSAFTGNDGGLIRVNRRNGAQRVLASNELAGPGYFENPFDLAVVPPRCGGQFATIYGGPRRDVLKGTRFADVIAGLAGSDRIVGLKGNDRLCGGRGRDRLRGGPGRDRLQGGPGRDIERR